MNGMVFLAAVLRGVLAAFSAFLMANAVLRFLPAGKGLVRAAIPYVIFFVTMGNKSWVGDENPLILFPFFLLAFLLCYGGPWYARAVTGIIFYVLLEPVCMMVDTPNLELIESIPYELLTTGVKTVAWGLLWLLIRRIAPKEGAVRLSGKLWALLGALSLAPLLSTLSFSIWGEGGFDYDTYQMIVERLAYTVLPFTMLSALALLVALAVLSRHEELEAARRLSEVQTVYYQSLQREQVGVRTLKHDLHNHIAAARSLLERGNVDGAASYLESLSDSPALAGSVRLCENEVANAVLAGKAAVMEREGMEIDWEVSIPAALPISDIELCALLGNALDNAIEAARDAGDKRIGLRARADKGMLMLKVDNAFEKAPRQENGTFRTTKRDSRSHGLGLAGMEEIVRSHGGSLEATAENGRFELVVCIPLV
ncbi:MAG: sensor histidine kinase [Oscillospiraceae bacterium]